MTMGSLWRHAFAVLVFPVTVVVIVPTWIARRTSLAITLPGTSGQWVVFGLGLAALIIGAVLFASCLTHFAREGEGTLAPWDPPARLVTGGPYAHVRNPMITGVVFLLIAEGLLFRSPPHLSWAGAFVLVNAVYIPLFEEPALRKRFGDEYEEYARHVPRLIPRLRPWQRT